MRLAACVFVGIAALGAAGCGHTDVYTAQLRTGNAPARDRADLYVGDQAAPKPFYEVALVQVVGFGNEANMESVSRALAARGGALGCDALVKVSIDTGSALAHGYGVCVRYLTPTTP